MRTKFLILLSFVSSVLGGQTGEKSHNLWLSAGFGFHTTSFLMGVTGFSSLNYSRSLNLKSDFSGHRSILAEFRYLKNIGLGDEDNSSNINEFDLLSGFSFGKVLQLRISGGVGLISGVKRIEYMNPGPFGYREEKIFKFGFPLELGINLVPIKYFGLGIKGFTNFNPELSIYGAALNIELGKIYGTPGNHEQKTTPAIAPYRFSIGLKAGSPYPVGITAKHFLTGNKALEGTISARKLYDVYSLFTLTLLIEDERTVGSLNGTNWFWGAGIHGGYGVKSTNDPYYSNYEQNIRRFGFDAIFGMEHTFGNAPINISFDIIPATDLLFDPFMSAGISVRYVFRKKTIEI